MNDISNISPPPVESEAVEETTQLQPVPQRKRRFNWKEVRKYLVSLGILGLGGVMLAGLTTMRTTPENTSPDSLIPKVKLYNATPYSGQLDMMVSGMVVPHREIKIASEVGGRIKVKHDDCQAGHYVTKGTPLLEIDPEEYELEVKTNQADVDQATQAIAELDQDITNANNNLEIAKKEYELQAADYQRNLDSKSALSDSELNQAERNFLATKSKLVERQNTIDLLLARKNKLNASLELSKSRLDKAKLNLARTKIVAPDDGVIVREMAEKGDYVARGAQLVIFEDTSRSEVICNLTQQNLDWIRRFAPEQGESIEVGPHGAVYRIPKTDVSIFQQDRPNDIWLGVLERFDGIGIDERTKTIPCRIVVDQPIIKADGGSRALVRGMYVKCKVEVYVSPASHQAKFIMFPEVGLRPGNYVWIVRDMKLRRVDVKVIDHTSGNYNGKEQPFVVVEMDEDGLQPNDQIVTTPLSQPTNDSPVELESESNTSSSEMVDERNEVNMPQETEQANSESSNR